MKQAKKQMKGILVSTDFGQFHIKIIPVSKRKSRMLTVLYSPSIMSGPSVDFATTLSLPGMPSSNFIICTESTQTISNLLAFQTCFGSIQFNLHTSLNPCQTVHTYHIAQCCTEKSQTDHHFSPFA